MGIVELCIHNNYGDMVYSFSCKMILSCCVVCYILLDFKPALHDSKAHRGLLVLVMPAYVYAIHCFFMYFSMKRAMDLFMLIRMCLFNILPEIVCMCICHMICYIHNIL